MTVIVLLINYPKSTITVVHWNDDSNETLFSSYLLGPLDIEKWCVLKHFIKFRHDGRLINLIPCNFSGIRVN